MIVNEKAMALIKEREGYKRELPDGRCTTYYCPAGKLTIGWGCTEGIREGDIWTREQAQAALDKELRKHNDAVLRLVNVPINDNQRSALVSFSYNVGYGPKGLGGSTLLRKLNKGDYKGAQSEFLKWDKATVTDKATGKRKKVVLRGLSIRRAQEAALFAERTEEENEEKGDLLMVQAVEPPDEPMSATTKAAIASAATGTGTAVVSAPPQAVTDTVSNVGAWQSIGKTAIEASTLAWSKPWLLVVAVSIGLGVMFWSDIRRRMWA